MATSILTPSLNVYDAEQFKEAVSESANSRLYFTVGNVLPWDDENLPPQANSSIATFYEVHRNMIAGKKIAGSDIYHCIPRIDWQENIVYNQYDHQDASLYGSNNQFYVVTSNWDIYKCLHNNYDGPSLYMPTQKITTGSVTEADGYTWKYMYTVSAAEQLRFSTPDYIPVKTLSGNDGSTQWSVQQNAIDGAIEHIEVEYGGQDYTTPNQIWVAIRGDGAGANAFAQTDATTHQINRIIVDRPGAGYTYANIEIYDESTSGLGAIARAVISPPGGHGSDPMRELGGSNLMVSVRLRYDEDGVFPVTNDFRQIAIIKDPLQYGASFIRSNTTFAAYTTLTLSGVDDDDYQEKEYVYQGPSLANATFKGVVVEWNSTDSTLKLINVEGNPEAQSLVGEESGATGTVAIPYTTPDIIRNSGQLLYIDNITPIHRSTDQIEDFKIVLKF